jgi:hypothetical protein
MQVHKTLDDGVELFGGTAHLSNVVISDPGDDGLDWDQGWTGSAQHVLIQLTADAGDNAIEADNLEGSPDAVPTSSPSLYNVTLVGSRSGTSAHRGALLRRGTSGSFVNFLATGFSLELLDIVGEESAAAATDGDLWISNGWAWDLGFDGSMVNDDSDEDDDAGFDETTWLTAEDKATTIGTFGGLPTAASDPVAPDFVPGPAFAVDPDEVYRIPNEDHLDQGAAYLGAVPPGDTDPWYAGWTAFPQN